MRLALDHLTVVDATPVQLAQLAAATDCAGLCVFLESMDNLPLMPRFDLVADRPARRLFKQEMEGLGLTLELAYPFTLSGRTEVASFGPVLDCAAELEAQLLNVLIYDREPTRRHEKFHEFCDLANSFGLRVALEFYPASQIGTLADGLALACGIGRPGAVGVNVDLLHLMRSGGAISDIANAPDGSLAFAQFADGPATRPSGEWAFEASSDRLLAGQGDFDLVGFARALPPTCPSSVEIPRDRALAEGAGPDDRAQAAIYSVRAALATLSAL